MILLPDIAAPHKAHITAVLLEIYSLYTLDLAPGDFHLFGPLKKHLNPYLPSI
jgi:hypothetical protein